MPILSTAEVRFGSFRYCQCLLIFPLCESASGAEVITFISYFNYRFMDPRKDSESFFLGIPLHNDISNASTWQFVGLIALLIVLVRKPKFARSTVAASFWGIAWGISYSFLADVTLIPLVTTIVATRTRYPYLVVIPHCIAANIAYRAANGDKTDRFRALLLGFFLYGFGGSIVSDVLLGLPATALAHPRIIPCHVLGWFLVWYSPGDWVYTSYRRPDSFFHYFIVAAEAVDAITTPMGRISRGGREQRNKGTAPIMGGLFAGIGGAIVRFLAGENGASMVAIKAAFYKTMGYSLLFWAVAVYRCETTFEPDSSGFFHNHCSTYSGSDTFRVALVSAHVLWTLLCDVGLATSHPFIWSVQKFCQGSMVSSMISSFGLGPQSPESVEGTETREKKD